MIKNHFPTCWVSGSYAFEQQVRKYTLYTSQPVGLVVLMLSNGREKVNLSTSQLVGLVVLMLSNGREKVNLFTSQLVGLVVLMLSNGREKVYVIHFPTCWVSGSYA